MPAYLINDMEVFDPQGLDDYKQLSPATVAQYGGKFLVRGGAITQLEGDWQPKRLVILEFPSVEQAQAWIDSPEYAAPRMMRKKAARSNIIVVEGVAPA